MSISNDFLQVINKVCNLVIDKKMKRITRCWSGKVVETSGSISQNEIASIYLNGDTSSTPINVKSKTNETLVANDEVILFSPSGSLSDVIVLYKK